MNNNVSQNNNRGVAKKTKKKFNIIDFFILVIILAVIAALVYAFSPWSHIKKLIKPNEVAFQYAVELKGVDDEFINLIKAGDPVINKVSKNSLGTIDRIGSITHSTFLDYVEETNEDGTPW